MSVDFRTCSLKAALWVALSTSLVAVSGCTSNSSFPSTNITTALTPQQSDLDAVNPDEAKNKPTPPAEIKTDPKASENPGDTKLALAQSGKSSPSVDAAENLVKSNSDTATPKTAPRQQNEVAKSSAENTSNTKQESNAKTNKAQGKGFFAKLFQPGARKPKRDVGETRSRKPAPKVKLTARKRATNSTGSKRSGGIFGLPGVKRKNIFDIEDEIEREEFDEPIRTASIANMATRGTHGLLLQRPGVKVGCFPRALLRILRQVERRYKRTPIVTSGYRDARHNRLVRGARKSTHVRCLAADIQVKGVSKWQLAKFLRKLPGRGGVGTYCHTKSVHIDVGSKRAWHHCRRSRKKRRKKA